MRRPELENQLPLFLEPQPGLPKSRRRPVSETHAARYTKYRPKRRTLCGDCIRDIHERGMQVAPHPQVACWRRVSSTGQVDVLCDRHRRIRTDAEL